MPTDYCQYFWECLHCKNNLKPKKGDCCVYCSYGNIKCPPIQKREKSENIKRAKKIQRMRNNF